MKSNPDFAEVSPDDALPSPGFGYDLLFAAAGEPVLIVDTATVCIVEANPAAATLLHSTSAGLIGTKLASAFEVASGATLQAGLSIVHSRKGIETVSVRALQGGLDLRASLSLFRTASKSFFLVRLAADDPGRLLAQSPGAGSVVFEAIDTAAFGFLMTDANLRINYANQKFIQMADQQTQTDLLGRSLLCWLTLSDADLSRLRDQLSQRQAVTRLTSKLRGAGAQDPSFVEIYAVAVPAGKDTCWGFSVNELRRLN